MPLVTRALVGGGTLLRKSWRGLKPKLLGVGFIAVVVGLVALSIAFYNKDFTNVTMVTLQADRIGRQLSDHADVKIRGLIVGEVRSTAATDTGATLNLAITPADMKYIPRNVQARILPKTLFGEKFVDLVVPDGPTGQPETVDQTLQAGAVIPQDRSTTAIELASVFNDLLPVLTAVKPQDLSTTLNSIATALQNQGNPLGENLVKVDNYFKQLNPAVPQLTTDISKLADLADNLNAAAPQFLRLLDQSAKESLNVTREHTDFLTFLRQSTSLSNNLRGVLGDNTGNLIDLGKVSAPTLTVLRENGQELPYIFEGETQLTPRINAALGGSGPFLHITLQLKADRGAYTLPEDCPTYLTGAGTTANASAIGPNCAGYNKNAPNGEVVVPGGSNLGNHPAKAPQSATSSYHGTGAQSTSAGAGTAGTSGASGATGSGIPPILPGSAGSIAEQTEIAALLGPVTGLTTGDVPGFADLLFGPAWRGAVVSQSEAPA